MKKTASKVVATVTPKPAVVEAPRVVTLTRSTKERKGSSVVFLIPGVRGTVKIARTAFAGEPPMTLDIAEPSPFAPPVVKMTKEERAAARAAMTPVQKAQAARERANRAARLAALEAAAK